MKKIMFKGIAALLVMFFVMFMVTCDEFIPGSDDGDEIVGYTDVEYVDTETVSQITVYIDGTKPVPVTKRSLRAMEQRAVAGRAMTRNLAMMAYDFLEVIFIGPTPVGGDPVVARTSWELGQSAGISGIYRNPASAATPYDYALDVTKACIFVGRKDGKTLLGVGNLTQINHVDYAAAAAGSKPYVDDNTKSVTFTVSAVITGLVTDDDNAAGADPWYGDKAWFDSFVIDDTSILNPPVGAAAAIPPVSGDPLFGYATTSSRFPLGDKFVTNYPMYQLPQEKGAAISAIYEFSFVVGSANAPSGSRPYYASAGTDNYNKFLATIIPGIKHNGSAPVVQARIPRYMEGGRYWQPKASLDTETDVKLGTYTYTDGANFNPVIPLDFKVGTPGGIFSFNIEIPVYMVTKAKATNAGTDAETWKIRTGFGSEFYSLDSGKSSGGCVLMGVGVTSLDWIEIEWDFKDN